VTVVQQQRQIRQASNTYFLNGTQCDSLPPDAEPASVDVIRTRLLFRESATIDEITADKVEKDAYDWEQ